MLRQVPTIDRVLLHGMNQSSEGASKLDGNARKVLHSLHVYPAAIDVLLSDIEVDSLARQSPPDKKLPEQGAATISSL